MSTITTPAEPVIIVTESAAGQIKHLTETNPENAGKHLRIYVEQGGCSGKQYGMVFDEKRVGDLVADMHGVAVLVDPVSAEHVRGSVVDFSDSLNAGGFKISNPNARQSCGCGKSFEA
jgi:iron-sulfur cluster assembly accessory protein